MAVGEICGLLAWATQSVIRTDWAQIWYAARALMHGVSPDSVVGPGRLLEWQFPLLYPLPAVVAGLPFALTPLPVAVGLFAGLSAAFLSFAITRDNWHRLLLLLGSPFLLAIISAQWSVLLTAAAVLSPLGFLLVTKPTIGAALWLYRPSRSAVAGGIAFTLISLAVWPAWLREWLATLSHTGHMVVPLLHAGGPLLLLSLLKWRRPEARLLLALACVPQTALLYEMVPLMLIPVTFAETIWYLVLSYVVFAWWASMRPFVSVAASIVASIHMVVPLLYIPCLIMVLRRPNEGHVPAWIDRGAARVAQTLSRYTLTSRALTVTNTLMQYGSGKISLRRPRSDAS